MDAQAKKKALYRAKLNAQKLEKRIDSPLVRYNESDQPVCRVCDVVLKSESLWPAHQASRKHHEAINTLKANAAGRSQINNIKAEPSVPLPKPKHEHSTDSHIDRHEPCAGSFASQASSVLPLDFFDNPAAKRSKNGTDVTKSGYTNSHKNVDSSAQTQGVEAGVTDSKFGELSGAKVVDTKIDDTQHAGMHTKTSQMNVVPETKQVKGALPEGFFDNKDADLRARGITPVKLDIKDEYKEFEKLIQGDLQEVDNRLEEEEYDAAETIEEFESLEQKSRRERVEMLKKKKMELKAARSAIVHNRGHEVEDKVSSRDEKTASSDDDDSDDDDFAVDWRAKRL